MTKEIDPNVRATALALVEQERPAAVKARDLALAFAVASHPEYETAGEVLRVIVREIDRLDAKRKELVGPLATVTRGINGMFAGPLEALREAEQALKGKIAAFDQAMRAARVEAVTANANASPIPYMPEAEGVSTRYERRFRVVDADKVPRQFCSPDEDKIKAYLRDGGVEAIAGIEFFDHAIVAVRR